MADIRDAVRLQSLRQGIGIELRVATRARHGADVDQGFDPVDGEQGDEVRRSAGSSARR